MTQQKQLYEDVVVGGEPAKQQEGQQQDEPPKESVAGAHVDGLLDRKQSAHARAGREGSNAREVAR